MSDATSPGAASAMHIETESVASEVLETMHLLNRSIFPELRRQHENIVAMHQIPLLVYLLRHPGTSLSALAKHLRRSAPTVSRMVDGLVAKGLVERCYRTNDRRSVALALTAEGQAHMDQARDAARALLARRLDGLDESERATLLAAMAVLRARMGEAHDA
jgi:DNA-binding MarR family transcriptional regulator